MRGERVVIVVPASVLPGSSPHARGTLRILIRRKPEKRFIPACAGNACPLFSIGHENPVHPRMRGERVISLRYDGFKGGSSPHARGTPFCTDIQVSPRRFIPACAGNAGRLRRCSRWMTVHPRMRGERTARAWPARCRNGSSPHARGTRTNGVGLAGHPRFIPACAGNALSTPCFPNPTSVHPRMRGERVVLRDGLSLLDGSSPHARGTREPVPGGDHPNRFIPACAGNARLSADRQGRPSVHPRMRGERNVIGGFSGSGVGSSPHARGTPSG